MEVDTTDGVPLIAPVEESSERPLGREGDTDQVVMAPPLDVGVTAVMAESFASVNEFGVYVMVDGAMSFTARETTVELLPPAFEAVTV